MCPHYAHHKVKEKTQLRRVTGLCSMLQAIPHVDLWDRRVVCHHWCAVLFKEVSRQSRGTRGLRVVVKNLEGHKNRFGLPYVLRDFGHRVVQQQLCDKEGGGGRIADKPMSCFFLLLLLYNLFTN